MKARGREHTHEVPFNFERQMCGTEFSVVGRAAGFASFSDIIDFSDGTVDPFHVMADSFTATTDSTGRNRYEK